MSITISNINIPPGCQKCKFFKKHLFGNGLDYSYSCILGAKDFPMPWIRQMEERASDCPIEPLEQEPVLDKIRTEVMSLTDGCTPELIRNVDVLEIIDKYRESEE